MATLDNGLPIIRSFGGFSVGPDIDEPILIHVHFNHT